MLSQQPMITKRQVAGRFYCPVERERCYLRGCAQRCRLSLPSDTRYIMDTITADNAEQQGDFGQYRKTALSKISNFTVPAGTTFRTPEGLYAEDEECRIAFDTQGGVYPIRESVFQESYEPA